ncbi:GlxA family transcriptional regulator [Flexibacterium corallicola]|uniref:GlxA family transcriptional regulator n=1 Tax=Flexibacterium corallicola TaxID=3037259 RepID=UPI00286F98E1|nr:DJ-1/PfpI family protein [Pseudovibrio sp. M1P-2-3]
MSHTTRSIDIFVFDGVNLLDLAGPSQAFTSVSQPAIQSRMNYKIRCLSLDGNPVTSDPGIKIAVDGKLADWDRSADFLFPGGHVNRYLNDPRITQAVQRAADRDGNQRLISVCSGALFLASAGVLDGRHATTHWCRSQQVKANYPNVQWQVDRIFVRSENIYTAAGVTSGIDLALALIEEDCGSTVALRAAQYLVVYMQRSGGQAQYSAPLALQSASLPALAKLSEVILLNPEQDWNVEALADCAAMSPRSLYRHFQRDLAMSPAQFVEKTRLDLAVSLLHGGMPLQKAADRAGFGTLQNLRRAFDRRYGVTPSEYIARFPSSIRPRNTHGHQTTQPSRLS